jgi:TatD DNase family protein
MIDAHAHLEQKDYGKDLDEVIKKCKNEGILAIITSCANTKDFERTMEIAKKYKNYVFPTMGIHPQFVSELKEEEIEKYIDKIRSVKDKIMGIGEIGLDYSWVKEKRWQEESKELFMRFLRLAIALEKPVIIHSRDAHDDTYNILEYMGIEKALWHMFGARDLIDKVKERGWYISIGPIIKKSKSYKKVARDMPLDKIMLETDSPWFGGDGVGYPTNIKVAAEAIAEVKKVSVDEVMSKCARNAIDFYNLPVKI